MGGMSPVIKQPTARKEIKIHIYIHLLPLRLRDEGCLTIWSRNTVIWTYRSSYTRVIIPPVNFRWREASEINSGIGHLSVSVVLTMNPLTMKMNY